MRENMRYAHFAEICENVAISEICGNRLRFVILMTDTWRVKRCIIIIKKTDMPSKYALTNRALGHIEGLTVPWVTLI